jgi:hypothetical protein
MKEALNNNNNALNASLLNIEDCTIKQAVKWNLESMQSKGLQNEHWKQKNVGA